MTASAAPAPFRLVVIGADDQLGEAVMREAVVRGLAVTATAADPAAVARFTRDLEVRGAAPSSEDELAAAVAGADAVVLGHGTELGSEPTMSRTDTTIALVRALRAVGVGRLVAASHVDLDGPARAPRALRGALAPLRRLAGGGSIADLRRMELLLETSGLRTTVLRAGRIIDLLGSKAYRLVPPEEAGAAPLPREDLARALVDQALEPASSRAVYAVLPARPS
ncbi:NAD(P)H-binding protein [Brachybacterium hainanense]|uniref:NAD(P)H-binding protein n=1 Tax=Brachybacterium hainanense TaxID=1541174 RepID=A0ABV6RG96_9MICO